MTDTLLRIPLAVSQVLAALTPRPPSVLITKDRILGLAGPVMVSLTVDNPNMGAAIVVPTSVLTALELTGGEEAVVKDKVIHAAGASVKIQSSSVGSGLSHPLLNTLWHPDVVLYEVDDIGDILFSLEQMKVDPPDKSPLSNYILMFTYDAEEEGETDSDAKDAWCVADFGEDDPVQPQDDPSTTCGEFLHILGDSAKKSKTFSTKSYFQVSDQIPVNVLTTILGINRKSADTISNLVITEDYILANGDNLSLKFFRKEMEHAVTNQAVQFLTVMEDLKNLLAINEVFWNKLQMAYKLNRDSSLTLQMALNKYIASSVDITCILETSSSRVTIKENLMLYNPDVEFHEVELKVNPEFLLNSLPSSLGVAFDDDGQVLGLGLVLGTGMDSLHSWKKLYMCVGSRKETNIALSPEEDEDNLKLYEGLKGADVKHKLKKKEQPKKEAGYHDEDYDDEIPF